MTPPYPTLRRLACACLFPLIAASPELAATEIPLVYDAEDSGETFPQPPLPGPEDLPVVEHLPDPFAWAGGSGRDARFSSWAFRRSEIKAQIEHYEIGVKPSTEDLVIDAAYVDGVLTVVVERGGRALTLTSRINLPAGSGPFPAVIGMALAPGGGTGSLSADIFTSRNIATIEYLHNQVTTYSAGQQVTHAGDPFYLLYPEYNDTNSGQYSAWSWGVSRLIDGLEIAAAKSTPLNPLPIDLRRLAVTGCSYAGKMALFAGALDERIALTIAQESGGGGAPAWRVSHGLEPDGTVEKIDNTDYSWFRDDLRQFAADQVYRLPHDHHMLMAMVAPRALLVTGNTDFTWLSNRSAYISARAAHEVYKTWGIGDRFGFYIDGGHGHCAIPASQRPAIEAFVDRFLLGLPVETSVEVHPYGDLDYASWSAAWSDRTPPVTVTSVDPAPRKNGWHDNAVRMAFTASDESSAVREIVVTLTGAQTGSHTFSGDTGEVVITAEGTTDVTYYAVDTVGNVEPAQVQQIKVRIPGGKAAAMTDGL